MGEPSSGYRLTTRRDDSYRQSLVIQPSVWIRYASRGNDGVIFPQVLTRKSTAPENSAMFLSRLPFSSAFGPARRPSRGTPARRRQHLTTMVPERLEDRCLLTTNSLSDAIPLGQLSTRPFIEHSSIAAAADATTTTLAASMVASNVTLLANYSDLAWPNDPAFRVPNTMMRLARGSHLA